MFNSNNTINTPIDQLPLISLRGLEDPTTPEFIKTADAIGQAARSVGFFRVCDHGIDLDLIEATYDAAARFFAQHDETKRRYYIGKSTNHRGYVPFTERGDYPDEVNRSYEAFDMGLDLPCADPDYLSGNRLLGPNVWPAMTGFKKPVAAYYAKISALGRLMCTALEVHLKLPAGAMRMQMDKPISQLRLLHYVRQASTKEHTSVNMGAHTDYECLTLLHTKNSGLQVMTKDDHWIDVPVNPEVFIVNIGDMLEAWSNGAFKSTPHRVLNLSPERFSLPYFVAANYDTLIKPFPELVPAGEAPKYEPFLAGEHLERMLVRDFPYLRHQMQSATIKRPGAPVYNPFEDRLQQGVAS